MTARAPGTDFIRRIIEEDLEAGRHGRIVTRFPPEPNGFLHIGHAKSVCLNFGVAEEFGGLCNLRFDDTNPATEDAGYAEAIERDVRWLGYEWEEPVRHASGYFERLYRLALRLIGDGRAYVDSLPEEEIRERRGTVTEPGRASPHRERTPEESRELFEAMRAGEFGDGEHVLRARIDMSSPNMKMRDPLLYRIRHARHYRTGVEWCIYPMYDWAHPLSDAIEGITHSLCTLEFENNRELYDWVVENTRPGAVDLSGHRGGAASDEPGAWDPRPRQYEFARLDLEYTVMSKRKLARLVEGGEVEGWDDPRMPTLSGLRRRGVTPEAIRRFCEEIGVSRSETRVDVGKLEHAIRDDLNRRAPRVMCVLRPLRVVIENYPEEESEELEIPRWPRDIDRKGSRPVPFSRELYIEREDFREEPPEGYRRLVPGGEVRLRHAYFLRCEEAVRDPDTGAVKELRCSYDPETRGGSAPDGREPRGTIHWVSAAHALPAEVHLHDRLFADRDPEAGTGDFRTNLNPESRQILRESRIEPDVAEDAPGTRYQFERQGYFIRAEPARGESGPGEGERVLFHRTISLRDPWARRRREAERAREAERRRAKRVRKRKAAAGRDRAAGRDGSPRSEERDRIRAESRELAEKFARYREELGLPEEDADVLTGGEALAEFFEAALRVYPHPAPVANWIIHELRGAMDDHALTELRFGGPELGTLVKMVEEETVSRPAAKEVLERMLEEGGDPRRIVEERGLEPIDDPDALGPIVDGVLIRNPDEARRFREGQDGLIGFFVGQVMRETRGKADPELVKDLVRERV